MKNHTILLVLIFISFLKLQAQLEDECKLSIGTNLAGLADYGREIPFVNLMRSCREWYSKSNETNSGTDYRDLISYREDGYPTYSPQAIQGVEQLQKVATIWAETDAWPAGEYTVLWEGTGVLDFISGQGFEITSQTAHRITFNFPNPGVFIEMSINESDINDPIHNIRVLMPGTEDTYETQPFYQVWLDNIKPFQAFRFMDWGRTNNWGKTTEGWQDTKLFEWEERARMDHYTWADNKGIPYEMMIKLMNDQDVDGWVCVPHRASDDFIRSMANYFKENLEPDRHLHVEYSNEVWNWLFDQTQWVNWIGDEELSWPQRIGYFVNNCLGIWTDVYDGQLDRITRVVGVQLSWLDLSQQICDAVNTNSYDAVSPSYYFTFNDEADAILDEMAGDATAADIASFARDNMPRNFEWIEEIKVLSDELDKKLTFYEGGQHLTAIPFGVEPTYAQALLDIQRDDLMYEMYNEWFDLIRTLQEGDEPLLLMNFSFIGARSARYGSWGVLESMYQDTNIIPAPKYRSIRENLGSDCSVLSNSNNLDPEESLVTIFPNPTSSVIHITGVTAGQTVYITDISGKIYKTQKNAQNHSVNVSDLATGLYFVKIMDGQNLQTLVKKIIKQ
ncbi:T9SS type A sorting domain-containing protein [Aquimarina sp. M1]